MPVKSTKATKSAKKVTEKSAAPKKAKGLNVGDKAPNVSLQGSKGAIKLAAMKGQKYVVYFYPKDDTSGCTKEACAFQDNLAVFKKAGVTVIGVSKDDMASHEKFAKKYKLNFNLGVDADLTAAKAFGVWVEKSMYGRKYMGMDRATFLVNEKGVIESAWRKVKVPGHVEEVLRAIKKG